MTTSGTTSLVVFRAPLQTDWASYCNFQKILHQLGQLFVFWNLSMCQGEEYQQDSSPCMSNYLLKKIWGNSSSPSGQNTLTWHVASAAVLRAKMKPLVSWMSYNLERTISCAAARFSLGGLLRRHQQ